MGETPQKPTRWSVPFLVLAIVVGVLLGFAAGAAVDRALSPVIGETGATVAGITTVVFGSIVFVSVMYRWFTRSKGDR